MALKHKVLVVSVLAGLLFWVADAGVHFLFFHDAPFLDVLILAVPPYEIYVRSVALAIALALGFILAAQFAKRERIEREVRKSRGFLQTVIDAIPAATIVVGRDYRIALANRCAREMAGGEHPAASHATCHQVLHHRDSPCTGGGHLCPLKEVIATKVPVTTTHTHCDAEGKEVSVEITAAPILDDAGQIVQMIESCCDITERKQAEEALRDSEKRLQSLFETMVEGVVLIAPDGQIIEANPAAERILGLTRHEITRRNYVAPEWKIIRPDGTPMPPEEMAGPRAMKERRPVNAMVMGVVRTDGSVSWITVSASPITDEAGEFKGVVGTFADITERKRAHEALRGGEERYRAIFEQAADSILLVDLQGRILEFNDRAHENLGYTREEFQELKLADIEAIESSEEVEAHIRKVVREGPDTFETKHRTKSGEIRDIVVRTRHIDIGGEGYLLPVWHDITDRKLAEEEIVDLAKFPAENPHPVLRIADDGTIISANKAAQPLLDTWSRRIGESLPEHWAELVSHVLVTGHSEDKEIKADGRIFLVTFAPIVEAGYVNLYAHEITDHKRAEEDARRSHELLRALASRLQAVREEERIELARMIHDDVGHSLAAIKMDLAWLNRRLPEAADEPSRPMIKERLKSISKMLVETIQKARATAGELRPGLLDDVGLDAAIEWEAKQFQRRTGVKCTFIDTAKQTKLDHDQSTALFRICQELLTNIASHAGATASTISLKRQGDELILEVTDNGKGIGRKQISSSRSLGILGMRERALVLGGRFSISGQEGRGTTATVRIPLGTIEAGAQ